MGEFCAGFFVSADTGDIAGRRLAIIIKPKKIAVIDFRIFLSVFIFFFFTS
jgi:hypothetical protein